jgi:hypothetical protein
MAADKVLDWRVVFGDRPAFSSAVKKPHAVVRVALARK